MHINIHPTIILSENKSTLARYPKKRIPNKLGQALEEPSNSSLGQLYSINLEYMVYSILLKQVEIDKLIASVQLLIQSDTLQYLSLFVPNQSKSSPLGDKEVTIQHSKSISTGRQALPIKLFYWSLIGQSAQLTSVLLKNNYTPILTGKGWDADYLRSHYTFTLHILHNEWDRAKEYFKTLHDTYEELAPVNKVYPRFYLPLWEALLYDDEASFNKSLMLCLENFKAYWSSTSDSNPYIDNDIEGHFSLEVTALIKVAILRGYKVTTTSDYTPDLFIDKDFMLDIDTKLNWYYIPKKINFDSGPDLEKLFRENQNRRK